ncbi:Calmodulin and related proteins (EF-Hand superfamily) protein [Dioscorea alata]|uniref:Calmodulin and related proteins (EF-Hand superfamily) protein n=1 Tax=Dioscorea alata TaxID=55571 RepID=A0ACB7U6I4_DIOAL|nr:Calmodulin and related proteins (EF-Hand superfamily) protein [Dioscorea alata]
MAPPQPSAGIDILAHVFSMMEAFRAFDSDNDGQITVDELGGIMSSLGYNPSRQEIVDMMRRGDTDGDGLLSIEEFLDVNTRELSLGSLAGSLSAALPALSFQSGDYEITGEELFEVLGEFGNLSLEQCLEIAASMDDDGDGAVNLEDFRLVVNALL